jgi:hypothetical protein
VSRRRDFARADRVRQTRDDINSARRRMRALGLGVVDVAPTEAMHLRAKSPSELTDLRKRKRGKP